MIQLSKQPEPKSLVNNKAAWTQVLVDHEAAGTKPTKNELSKYTNEEIKTALKTETNGKCAYCESKFAHIAYGDVEHIVPKKKSAQLRFEWKNLTIACDVCNTNKGDRENLVDPYTSDPESLFVISGPVIMPRPDSSEALQTEIIIKLNRIPLVERRTERIKYLHDIILLAMCHSSEQVRRVILEDLKYTETGDDKEFAAITRAYIKKLEDEGII